MNLSERMRSVGYRLSKLSDGKCLAQLDLGDGGYSRIIYNPVKQKGWEERLISNVSELGVIKIEHTKQELEDAIAYFEEWRSWQNQLNNNQPNSLCEYIGCRIRQILAESRMFYWFD